MNKKTWEIMKSDKKDIFDILLENRGIKTKEEINVFFNPIHPKNLKLKDLKIKNTEIKKAVERIKLAKKKKEKVIIYGDYDADGISASAIMWEALHKFGLNVMPYIPDRFKEGYGINKKSLQKIIDENPDLKLIITVDNGIVAKEAIKFANKEKIDVIITDHHTKEKINPKTHAIIHTTLISGSAVAWILSRELGINDGLELAAIGTIADQMPLIGANRSFVKYGLSELNKTKRIGLIELLKDAGVKNNSLGTYEINYIIAPHINSMGRLKHGIESLRLLCTKDKKRSSELAKLISKTNNERQSMVEKTIVKVKNSAKNFKEGVIFVSGKNYHEGIIGLAAGKLVEEFYRPAVVVSIGEKFSKGSARSISGFNIIEIIREQSNILVAHGGHIMAAGFTIETAKLEEFKEALNKSSKKLLTKDLLFRKLKIDCELDFDSINWELAGKLKEFEPTGLGNPTPNFLTKKTEVTDARLLGKDRNHLKLKLKKGNNYFDCIGFGLGQKFSNLKKGDNIDVVYSIEENIWNGTKNLQLKIQDLKL